MIAMTSAPRLYCASSEGSGRFTLMMMSASLSASALTLAPAAVNSESGRPDLMPAPGSMAMSTPRALNFFTVSGDAATRGSEGSISLATAIFISPPAARGARGQPPGGRPINNRSGQKNRHHGENDDNSGRAIFHQHDEPFVRLLMGRIIVALGCRVGHLVMLRHQCLRSMFASAVELPQSIRESNGDGPFCLSRRGFAPQDIASSSSIMPAMTDSPPSQKFGSLASSPNGLSSSE